MRYSLQERFLGAYLASVLGEELSMEMVPPKQISWLEIHQKLITQIPLSSNQSLSWENLDTNIAKSSSISEMTLALLPIILYYHDNLPKLKFLIHQTAQSWQIPLSKINDILWWSLAITLILRGKLTPDNLWQQLTITTEIFNQPAQNNLASLKILFDRGLSITEVTEELSSITTTNRFPFLLSWYCFSQTPENFVLTMKQATTVKNRVPNILPLTGFLSGSYNTRIGLPLNWEKFCQNGDNYHETYQLGSRVFALWSGIYTPGKNINISAIIATPRTLQNRSGLKIISQKEYELP